MNEIKNIIELFNVVNTGKSVVCNRVDICNINGKDGDVNLLAILNKYNLEMSVLYEKVDKYFKKSKIKRR